jgi:DtxR family transcriptional regulator, Mn-dependent transcriptional regulator
MLTTTEENYLKAIWKRSANSAEPVSTNAIAAHLCTTAASVTDMLRKLADKELIAYEKYKGVHLTDSGKRHAVELVRRHRLWEVFLVERLGFGWDEVHDLAEELEHLQSDKLTERLAAYLGNPRTDPHGDPIPDAEGNFEQSNAVLLATLSEQDSATIVGVDEHSSDFLQYLDKHNLTIGTKIKIETINAYDNSLIIKGKRNKKISISSKVAQNLLVILS